MISGFSDERNIHQPVLLNEVLEALNPGAQGLFVDCTLGGGGHALAILRKGGNGVRLIGIDRDADAIRRCGPLFEQYGGAVELAHDRFENLASVVAGRRISGILFDLGVSSYLLDNPERGFSFQADGPLDMRMDTSRDFTAADIVNEWGRRDLATIFRRFGEERYAGRIAAAIESARAAARIVSTIQLAEIVKSAVPGGYSRIHPATRVFQALRIAVNEELDYLAETLETAVDLLESGGRLAVIAFHSLEDRIAKQTFAKLARKCVCPPDFPICKCRGKAIVKLLTRKPIRPREEEILANPRARSARLRVVEKLAA